MKMTRKLPNLAIKKKTRVKNKATNNSVVSENINEGEECEF